MAKNKWLRISTKFTLSEISSLLAGAEFRRGGSEGVDLTEVDDDFIKARFIEEILDTEIYINPFGEEIRYEIRRYSTVAFVVFPQGGDRFLLRVDNPPRSIKNLVAFLSGLLGFGFSISPLSIEILPFIEGIKNRYQAWKFRISKIRVGSLHLADSTIARIEVASKYDAYNDLAKSIKLDGGVIEKVSLTVEHSDFGGIIEFSTSGSMCGEDELIERLTPICIEYFRKQEGATGS